MCVLLSMNRNAQKLVVWFPAEDKNTMANALSLKMANFVKIKWCDAKNIGCSAAGT